MSLKMGQINGFVANSWRVRQSPEQVRTIAGVWLKRYIWTLRSDVVVACSFSFQEFFR